MLLSIAVRMRRIKDACLIHCNYTTTNMTAHLLN